MNNLDFLDKFINPLKNEYEQPSFLKSKFLDDVWMIEYSNKKTSKIDFKVKMRDGLYLTDAKHRKTLNTLKYWITFHTLDNENERKSKSIMSESIFAILTFFDAFNIQNNDTQLEKYGFEYLSENHIKYILDLLANNSDKFISIYQLKDRIIETYIKKSKVSFWGKVDENNIDNWDEFNKYYENLSLRDLYPDSILKPVKKPTIKHIEIDKQRTHQEFDNILQDDEIDEKRSFLSIRVFRNVLISLKKLHTKVNKFEYPVSLPNKNMLDNIEHFETQYKNK